jgi:hypothetical protein
MCGAPECLPAFGARTFLVLSNNIGSETTFVETFEQTCVVCHVAEPWQFPKPAQVYICEKVLYTLFFMMIFEQKMRFKGQDVSKKM